MEEAAIFLVDLTLSIHLSRSVAYDYMLRMLLRPPRLLPLPKQAPLMTILRQRLLHRVALPLKVARMRLLDLPLLPKRPQLAGGVLGSQVSQLNVLGGDRGTRLRKIGWVV